MLALRALVGLLLFGLSAAAFGFAVGLAGAGVWLIIAFFGAPPVFAALLVFTPLERQLDRPRLRRFKTLIVSLLGALFVLLLALLVWSLTGGLSIGGAPLSPLAALIGWTGLGAAWGGLWRLSDMLAAGLRNGLRIQRLL